MSEFVSFDNKKNKKPAFEVFKELHIGVVKFLQDQLENKFVDVRDNPEIAAEAKELIREFVNRQYKKWTANSTMADWPSGSNGEIGDRLFSIIFGLGPFDAILAREDVEDLAINGPNEAAILVSGQGWEFLPAELIEDFKDNSQMLLDIFNIDIDKTGQSGGLAKPIINVQMPSGHRLNILSYPIAHKHWPLIVIRRHRDVRFTMDDYLTNEIKERETEPLHIPDYLKHNNLNTFFTPSSATFLHQAILASMNTVVIGRTGVGKTALISCLGDLIPTDRRVFVIEDTPELKFRDGDEPKNTVYLTSIEERSEGGVEMPIYKIVKEALRQRPDHLAIGESRGAEMWDIIQAIQTGHNGMITSVHAISPQDMVNRVEYMISLPPHNMTPGRKNVANYVSSSFHVAIHLLQNIQTKRRYVNEIAVFTGLLPDEASGETPNMQTVFKGGPENNYELKLVIDKTEDFPLEEMLNLVGLSFQHVIDVAKKENQNIQEAL